MDRLDPTADGSTLWACGRGVDINLERSDLSHSNGEVQIYQVTDLADLQLVAMLSKEVWGEGGSISGPEMAVHLYFGGVILLAKRGGAPIGFSYSFPAVIEGETVLWSHETAVVERDSGLGFAMKSLQKKIAKEMGYPAIMWSYDPLQARNGYFNLSKLNARVVSYKVNAYGKIEGDLQSPNLPTDRFIVRLDLAREKTEQSCDGSPEVLLDDFDGSPVVSPLPWPRVGPYAVAIPNRSVQGEHLDYELALKWITGFRKVVTELFASGMTEVTIWHTPDRPFCGYLFCRPSNWEAGR